MSKASNSGFPGVNAMADTFDFFKNMWSGMPGMNLPGMNLPSMVMPSLSVDEVNRQIKDLKAVESWLSLNLSMLQGTIQALEVQKATIATIQTMGESFSAAMQPQSKPEESAGKSHFDSPFSKPAATVNQAAKPAPQAADATAADVQNALPPMANPAAWWGMLQDQFKQAVNTATAMTEAPADPAPEAKSASAPPARKRKSSAKDA